MTFDVFFRYVFVPCVLIFAAFGLAYYAVLGYRERKGRRSGEDEYLSALRRVCGGDGWRW